MGYDLPSWLTPSWLPPFVPPIWPPIVPPILVPWLRRRRHWWHDPKWWLLGTVAGTALGAALALLAGRAASEKVGAKLGLAVLAAVASVGDKVGDAIPGKDPKPDKDERPPVLTPRPPKLPEIDAKATFPLSKDSPRFTIHLDPSTGEVTVTGPDGAQTGKLTKEQRLEIAKLYKVLAVGDPGPTWNDTILASLTAGGESYSNSPAVREIISILLDAAGVEDPRSPGTTASVPPPHRCRGILDALGGPR